MREPDFHQSSVFTLPHLDLVVVGVKFTAGEIISNISHRQVMKWNAQLPSLRIVLWLLLVSRN